MDYEKKLDLLSEKFKKEGLSFDVVKGYHVLFETYWDNRLTSLENYNRIKELYERKGEHKSEENP